MNRLECSALRGIAILGIVLHNFAHWLPGAAVENEFSYSADRNVFFWQSLISSDWLIHFFSFIGHLGVPVFVFLSGYGLAQKYDQYDKIDVSKFLISHYIKLFVPLVIGTLIYLIVLLMIEGRLVCSIPRLIVQCTLLLNLVYPYEQHITPGPYWYFGMTMQLYIIYVFLLYKKSMKPLAVLTVVCIIAQIFLYNSETLLIWTKYNSIGWQLPFFMGVLMSRQKYVVRGNKLFLLLFMCLFITIMAVMGFNYFMWLFIPGIVVLVSICMVKLLPEIAINAFGDVGAFSMFVFVVHPIIRAIIIPLVFVFNAPYTCWFVYIVLSLFVAFVISNKIVKEKIKYCSGYIRHLIFGEILK